MLCLSTHTIAVLFYIVLLIQLQTRVAALAARPLTVSAFARAAKPGITMVLISLLFIIDTHPVYCALYNQ